MGVSTAKRGVLLLLVLALSFGLTNIYDNRATAKPTCGNRVATLTFTGSDNKVVGKKASDVIIVNGDNNFISGGTNGSDIFCVNGDGNKIITKRGNDKVSVAGSGNVIIGGQGYNKLTMEGDNNYAIGNGGNDTLISNGVGNQAIGGSGGDLLRTLGGNSNVSYGGDGSDTIRVSGDHNISLGQKGNDQMYIHGGISNILRGDMGDDQLLVETGDANRMFGGLGYDRIRVQTGNNNILRGDSGYDLMDGGSGDNIASFATHTPPGALAYDHNGIYALLNNSIVYGQGFGLSNVNGLDRVVNIHRVIGTAFDDKVVGTSTVDGGLGTDTIIGGNNVFTSLDDEGCDAAIAAILQCVYTPLFSAPQTTVSMGNYLDSGGTLYVLGGTGNNQITIDYQAPNYLITDPAGVLVSNVADGLSGSCQSLSSTQAVCSPGTTAVDTIVAYTDGGDNSLTATDNIPHTVAVTLAGGPGNDIINGSDNDDYIIGGRSGSDVLNGNGGSDAIQTYCCNDQVFGGADADMIVVNIVCSGTNINSGGGKDLVGFAPSREGVYAVIGGSASAGGCGNPTHISDNTEGLEGTKHDDVLVGNSKPNSLYGRSGRDQCVGKSGKDEAINCEIRRGIP